LCGFARLKFDFSEFNVIKIMSTAKLSVLSIDGLLERLESRSKLHAGYPYNLAFDSHRILPLLKYTLNNLGDAYVEGNYGINTKDFEREIISFFCRYLSS